jgi:glycogen operon protein
MGAQADAQGVNFVVFSAHATAVLLCVFNEDGTQETARYSLQRCGADLWSGHLPGARPGLVYGLRAQGPWRPERGHHFNPNKLLLDPWAREIVAPPGGFDVTGPHDSADPSHPQQQNGWDNAAQALKARVVAPDEPFDWAGDRPLQRPLADTVLYELHVRAFSRLMPTVPEAERGTYAGLASDAAIAHLQQLGVTAVSLLPVHQNLSERRLVKMGLRNHWGYNTVGFFCPEPRYAAGTQARDEFKQMVKRLHAAGIEVVLDVVFNHTAESDEHGPTLAWRGLDNASWYRLHGEGAACRHYDNFSGTGNTLNLAHPRVLQMVMDSLRHWVQAFHVDGFRFDLAPVLGRGDQGFSARHAFFQALAQDPVLAGTKLIAEPWDIGPGGYQLGQFPEPWLEWNDQSRDTFRGFWLTGGRHRGDFALRLAGSADLYQARHRRPSASVNYAVSHDGFTLADLVAYNERHNHANGEGNRDGHGHNLSWNCGEEGPSQNPEVLARRARLQRALLATVLFSQGTPMLAAGDEFGHSQQGNNNPYCQDNAITWLDWSQADQDLLAFTAHAIALRRQLRPLGDHWYTGLDDRQGRPDLAWRRADGRALDDADWHSHPPAALAAWIGQPGGGGAPLLLLCNPAEAAVDFQLPPGRWQAELDSTTADGRTTWVQTGSTYPLGGRSVALLRDTAA